MRRVSGFTLIEIVLTVCIMMLVLLLAVPSLNGVLKDRRLRQSLDRFNTLVSKAREQSITEHRPYLLIVGNKSVEVRPEVISKDDEPEPVADLPLSDRDSIKITFPAAMIKQPPAEWVFWPSGVCEPAIVDYLGRSGLWRVTYSALNAQPEITQYAPR
ncbi:MAG: Tfp pilus assembly protein FimT/FimU [Chthoniobacterales bacterium]